MKIGITGHTRGLGKALFDYYQIQGHEVVGFSSSTGHNIVNNFDEIVGQVKDFDLFINNAYKDNAQARFVEHLCKYPVDIISMGLVATLEYKEKMNTYTGWKKDYLYNKQLLLETHIKNHYGCRADMLLVNLDSLENHPYRTPVTKFKEIIDLLEFWLTHKNISIIHYTNRNNQ